MSLKQKTISGLFWTFGEQFTSKGIGFLVQIVLARILLPEEFGLIAMITVFIGIGHSMVDSGMTSSLIRTINPDQRDYSTVFYINVIVSFVVYGIIYVCAPAIGSFYEQPMLVDLVRVYALIIVIQSFVTVQITRMTKEMNFRIQMIIQVPSIIVGGIVGIILASRGWGVWALVYMALVKTIISTVQYWFYTGWRPDWVFDRQRLWEHFNFGYKLTLAGFINIIFINAYNIVIGKFFSAAQVGFYSKADDLQRFPVQSISTALSKVTFPMFSEIQKDNVKLKMVYRKVMQQVMFWITPMLTFGYIAAEPLFRYVLTEKWLPAVPYFQVICFVGLLYPIQAYNLNVLKVKGRSDLFLKLSIIKRSITTLGIILAIPYGIFALLYFQVINSLISYFINSYYTGIFIQYPALKQLRDIIPIILIGIGSGIATYFAIYELFRLQHTHDLVQIATLLGLYSLLYFGTHIVGKSIPYMDFKDLVLNKLYKPV